LKLFVQIPMMAMVVCLAGAVPVVAIEMAEPQGRASSSASLPQRCGEHLAKKHGADRTAVDGGLKKGDNPLVSRYHEQIRQGRGVVEALRSGVEMNPLEQFMNIDSVGVLRKQTVSKAERSKVILQALRQVGKPYDFNFDVESKGKVYCSKLVYLTYSGIEWPTKKSLGRTTFTPDDVAAKALSGDFQLVLFYHDGKQVEAPLLQRMAELMRAPQQQAAVQQTSAKPWVIN